MKNTNTGRDYTRFKVRERDKFTCQECKKKWKEGERHFDVHHLGDECGKKSRGYDKISDMANMITLCHKCHLGLHAQWTNMVKLKHHTDEIMKMWRSGNNSQDAIAKRFKVSQSAICKHIQKVINT